MAELTATIDMTEKTGENLVRAENVVIEADEKNWVYFMTNDYATICGVLGSSGCRPPLAEDLEPDPRPDKKLSDKMKELGATWALTRTRGSDFLCYYDRQTDSFFATDRSSLKVFEDENDFNLYQKFAYALENGYDRDELLGKIYGVLEKAYREDGVDVNAPGKDGSTMLTEASNDNDIWSLKFLLRMGADVNATDANGVTALMYAAMNGCTDAAEILLSVPGIELEKKEPFSGATALHFAASYGFTDMCALLVKAGADINTTNNRGFTALAVAVSNELTHNAGKATDFLMRAGTDLEIESGNGDTALTLAACHGSAETVWKLLEAGADAGHRTKMGLLPFSCAVCHGNAGVVKFFMEQKLFPANELERALVEAGHRDFAECAGIMIGMSDNPPGSAYCALFGACCNNGLHTARICMEYGPDVNQKTIYRGMTLLMLACHSRSNYLLPELLSAGADVNAADDYGMTALMYAASKENMVAVNFLLGNGADKTARSSEGKDYEDYLREPDKRDTAQLLADRTNADSPASGKSPGMVAGHKSFGDTFDFYRKKYFGRFPDRKNSDIYRAAGLSKQRFSKILSSRDPDYHPRKENVIALALGLRLTLAESEDLMRSAGCPFLPADKTDMLVKDFLSAGKHDIHELNGLIYEATGKSYFKSMTAGDEE